MRAIRRVTAVALAVVATAAVLTAGATPDRASAAAPGTARWSPCHRKLGPYECAVVPVPLDHQRPEGATISLALIRLPAGDPSRRIGSLFVNPGGPGGSGFDLVLFAGPFLFPPRVSERFDIVGFDPRGIARSTPLRCAGSVRQLQVLFTGIPFPDTGAEEDEWIAKEQDLVQSCDRRHGRIGSHMSTANAARDLDLLREAVGDEQLTYYGVSYGSFLGTTYANLFPGRVRALGVDSVLDPVKWVNAGGALPFSTTLGSATGAADTLRELFRLCDAGRCAFAPNSEQRFEALALRLRAAPLQLENPDGSTFSYRYNHLVGDALFALYYAPSWPSFAELLAHLESRASAEAAGARRAFHHRIAYTTKRGFPRYPNFVDGFAGVICSDTDNPDGYAAWRAAADQAEAQDGHFGRIWTWVSSLCAEWTFSDSDRYTGPFTATTANPVLVVGNRFDPATPFAGAAAVDDLLPRSALLTVEGWGHGSIGSSRCVDDAVAAYLVDKVVPAPGATCHQDFVPFAGDL